MPLFDLFWTMLYLFFFVAWIWVLFSVVTDIFRNQSTGGVGKALWMLFVIFLPVIGVLTYLIVEGDDMSRRSVEHMRAAQDASRAYIREAAGTTSVADELTKLAALRDAGTISDDEFAAQKDKLLA